MDAGASARGRWADPPGMSRRSAEHVLAIIDASRAGDDTYDASLCPPRWAGDWLHHRHREGAASGAPKNLPSCPGHLWITTRTVARDPDRRDQHEATTP